MAKNPPKNAAATILLSSLAQDPVHAGHSVEELAQLFSGHLDLEGKSLDDAIDQAINKRLLHQEVSSWGPYRDEVRRRGDEPAGLSPATGTITTGHYGPPGPGEALAPEWAIKEKSLPNYPDSIPIIDREAWENYRPERRNPLSAGFEDMSDEAWGKYFDANRADEKRWLKRFRERDAIENEAYRSKLDYERRPGGQSYMQPSQAEKILKDAAGDPGKKKQTNGQPSGPWFGVPERPMTENEFRNSLIHPWNPPASMRQSQMTPEQIEEIMQTKKKK